MDVAPWASLGFIHMVLTVAAPCQLPVLKKQNTHKTKNKKKQKPKNHHSNGLAKSWCTVPILDAPPTSVSPDSILWNTGSTRLHPRLL